MQTDTTHKQQEPVLSSGSALFRTPYTRLLQTRSRALDVALLLVLALAALLPRIALARSLDVVTDETVYILAAKIYFHQAAHLAFFSSAWDYNYEHPALVKLLIGLVLILDKKSGYLLPELFAARIPSILAGTLLVVATYGLGKHPLGRAIAFPAALFLAFSPWLSYFSALAYLDMTMTLFVSLAFLLLWYAPRHPWLYPLIAICIALGAASKYTAALALPGVLTYALLATFMGKQRIPWRWWLGSGVLLPLVFFAADPGIWRSPLHLLRRSLDFEWLHASDGHQFFLAGQVYAHPPFWTILFITLTKMSLLATLPAAAFILCTLVALLLSRSKRGGIEAHTLWLFCWLSGILIPFSQLTIVVGTHYELPVAAPVALAAAYSLSTLLRFLQSRRRDTGDELQQPVRWLRSPLLRVPLLCMVLAGPSLWGLLSAGEAEGYTSELFQGENGVLQVAYPGYREGALWIAQHSRGPVRVGLVALVNTLNHGSQGVSWYNYNAFLPDRLSFSEANPGTITYASYTYLIWPMHLVQRGYELPPPHAMHIVHLITGGQTIYCYILARSTVSISQ